MQFKVLLIVWSSDEKHFNKELVTTNKCWICDNTNVMLKYKIIAISLENK